MRGSTRGAPSAYTDAGPPLRMSAYGLRARTASGEIVCADELRVDAALAHAARDQLRVLAAEVDHQHRPVLHGRELDDVRRLSGDSSAPLS